MPFGAIFGALFFALFRSMAALRCSRRTAGTTALSRSGRLRTGLGLLLRRRWARWAGAGFAAAVALLMLRWISLDPGVGPLVFMLGAANDHGSAAAPGHRYRRTTRASAGSPRRSRHLAAGRRRSVRVCRQSGIEWCRLERTVLVGRVGLSLGSRTTPRHEFPGPISVAASNAPRVRAARWWSSSAPAGVATARRWIVLRSRTRR